MNQLIKIEPRELAGATVQTCNARDLWQFVESRQEFANWIKGRIEKYGFAEGEDYTVDRFINGRATTIDYHLTIEMAKELAMVENNEKGRQVRRLGGNHAPPSSREGRRTLSLRVGAARA
ncbi:phage anti-repressor protein AntB-like protein [Thauera sp. 27]|uniref:antA/AntB antirepressor family protein n=1 Tax=Thauera sp. 27 TaxID=305700 RepID=UPI0002D08F00|nr:antA/AntB antirepressor family protein [Thauera sp. 27]ENO82046.1 phage anti-repressor protein AntB-like protein [Thauera sp. 27]